ncbi:hypothetical protein FVQ98_06925 [Ottowia sp. GY511]|uniref:Uncharacterized protein n=1 Tax=Ottowia flava TaxID=2675430 RepID=A0ABW4KU26_9BURK|nr:hypothetical protein [Ottowia sp. GY511]TXK31017.1 hypothetical protein FVQ98_06925 [Ottowia sp. GY511]
MQLAGRYFIPKPALHHLLSLTAAAALGLSACGGGDDNDDPSPPPAPEANTLTGQVARSGALKNVVVCLDLNANKACDADEPASGPTGADGKYTVKYDPTKVTPTALTAAALIAQVKAGDAAAATTAIDADFPTAAATTADYVLTRPAGTGGAINPLTTLVTVGMAGGMTEAVARENVAIQLGIAVAKIDNYQDDPPQDPNKVQDTARLAAAFTSSAIRVKAPLRVADQKAAASESLGDLTSLVYTDAANYAYSQNLDLQKTVNTTETRSRTLYKWVKAGALNSDPFDTAYLTATGWTICRTNVPFVGTAGNPNRGTNCGADTSMTFRMNPTDLGGKVMKNVVTEMASGLGNTINVGAGSASALASAVGEAQFPAASTSTLRIRMKLNTPVYTVFGNGFDRKTATQLEQLIPIRQASTVNLSTGSGMLSLGALENDKRNLRVSFTSTATAATGPVQYYGCDLTDGVNPSNCTVLNTGTYTISTENGVRLMRFEGHPVTFMNHIRGYTEFDWGNGDKQIFGFRQLKPSQNARTSYANRINATGWAAMAAQLGI